jgi:peptidoglycan/LPS O-acetylase OafA/YrhL
MKRAVFVFILPVMVLITSALWLLSSSGGFQPFELLTFGIIILVVAFAVFLGFKRIASARRGEPAEDELSKMVMRKTSSLSYYISLYLWLAIMYFSERMDYETHTIIGAGILGMAVIFAVCWLVVNFTGIRNE